MVKKNEDYFMLIVKKKSSLYINLAVKAAFKDLLIKHFF